MNVKTGEAIMSLAPDAKWDLVDNDLSTINWIGPGIQPSDSAVATEIIRLQAIEDGNAYQRTRADAYKEVKEQLDQLYHDMTAGKLDATGEWHKAIKAVKDATPKP